MDQFTLLAVYFGGTFLVVVLAAGYTLWQRHRRRSN